MIRSFEHRATERFFHEGRCAAAWRSFEAVARASSTKSIMPFVWTTYAHQIRVRTHPGEMIKHEFLEPAGMSATALAKALGIPANRMTEIIAGRRGVTADTAIRLARYWGTSVEFWTNMQTGYEVSVAASAHDYSRIKPRAA